MTPGDTVASVTAIMTAAGLGLSIYQRVKLDKRHYALDMLSEWNHQISEDRMTIEKAFPGLYQQCIPLSTEEAKALVHGRLEPDRQRANSAPESERPQGHVVREATIRLLNYFEYVSQAVQSGAANRKIIRESFVGTMIRFYCLLGAFIEAEQAGTSRNPWAPYSRFVFKVTKSGAGGLKAGTCLDLQLDGKTRRFICRGKEVGGPVALKPHVPMPDTV